MKLALDTVVQSTDGSMCGCPCRNCRIDTPCRLREDYLIQHVTLNSYDKPLNYSQSTFNKIYRAYHSTLR